MLVTVVLLTLSGLCTCCPLVATDKSSYTSSNSQLGLTADGKSEAPAAVQKGSKAQSLPQNGVHESPAYNGECWAFSSHYIKTTQAALQTALGTIEVVPAFYTHLGSLHPT